MHIINKYFHSYFLNTISMILVSLGIFYNCSDNSTQPIVDGKELKYVTPEEVGYSSAKLKEVKHLLEKSGYSSMMAVYDGEVFFEWGDITVNYLCHSIRKPFLSSLFGIHVEQENINLDATLKELGIDDIPPSLTEDEKKATVRDLLKSRSGIYHEAAAETQEMKVMRPERGSHSPGTFFYYNNWDFNALGTIFEQQTGVKIFEEFKAKVADPIGMEDFDIDNCYYQYEQEVSMHPAYSFRMSARDMARFGVLYQKGGIWDGEHILSEEWIEESTKAFSILDSNSGVGYGYMWKSIPEESAFAQLIGSSGYFHTGLGVHVILVLPKKKLVIVQRLDTNGVWTDPGDLGMELGLMIINSQLP